MSLQKELPRSVQMAIEKIYTQYRKEARHIFERNKGDNFYQQNFDKKFPVQEDFEKALNKFQNCLKEKTVDLLLKKQEITDDYTISNGIISDNNGRRLTIYLKYALYESGLLTTDQDYSHLCKQPLPAFTNTRIFISPYFDSPIIPDFSHEICNLIKTIPSHDAKKEDMEKDFIDAFYRVPIQNLINETNIGDISIHSMESKNVLYFIKSFLFKKNIINVRNTIVDANYLKIIKKYQNM